MSTTVAKSYEGADPLIKYMAEISTPSFEPIQRELMEETLARAARPGMVGAPEVLEMGKAMINLTQARKVLDIGTFTGASALAWALALPEDGKVITMDVSHEELEKIGLPILSKVPELKKKIEFKRGSAVDTLQALIDGGESGTFSFAFIDADKANYSVYYEKSMQLLKKGGVIMVDNALWNGTVVTPKDDSSRAIDAMNRAVSADNRSMNTLLNCGDGVHLIVKKHD